MIIWYEEKKGCQFTPYIAINSVKQKIDEYKKFKDELDKLTQFKTDRYKKINDINYLSW